jgi:hypothetical protein
LGVAHGRVKVGGKTLTEAEAIIQELVAQVIQNPSIQVTTDDGVWRDNAQTKGLVAELQRHIAELKAQIQALEQARDAEYRRKK